MERKRIFRRKLYKTQTKLSLTLSILYEPLQIRRWCVVRCKLPCISSAILNMFTLILNSWLILCWKLWCGGRLPPRSSLVYTQLWCLGFCLQKTTILLVRNQLVMPLAASSCPNLTHLLSLAFYFSLLLVTTARPRLDTSVCLCVCF